jgi:hypothetical protein
VDLQIDDGSFSFPLIPSDLDELEFSVYSLKSDSKAKVVLYRNEDSGKVEYAAYDRFLYRRTYPSYELSSIQITAIFGKNPKFLRRTWGFLSIFHIFNA